jgi:ABC-type transport system involved in cytochrome c biogenesis permease subunit
MLPDNASRIIATKHIYFVFTIIEYVLLAYMYKLELNTDKTKNFFWLSLVLFFVVAFFELFSNSIITFSSALSAAFLIAFAIAVFYQIFKEQEIPLLSDYYFFWINAAILIYFGAYFFLSFFEIYIRTIPIFGQFLVAIHSLVAITFHIILTIGICKIKKR